MDTCIKVNTGLYCTFYISTYSATTSYKRYIPVNYNGIEVKLPGQNIVVKSSETDEQGLLYCEKPPVSSINSCSFQNWDPIKHLLRETHFYQYETVVLRLQTFHYLCRPMTTQFLSWILYLKQQSINPAQGTPQIPIMNQSPMIVSFFKDKILFGSTNILF